MTWAFHSGINPADCKAGAEVWVYDVQKQSMGCGVLSIEGSRVRSTVNLTCDGFPVSFVLAGVSYPLRNSDGTYLPRLHAKDSVEIRFDVEGPIDPTRRVMIDYTNWKGVRAIREIEPIEIFFGSTPWHPEPQWLLRVWDVEKGEKRECACAKISNWRTP